jgi:hypothetical protein
MTMTTGHNSAKEKAATMAVAATMVTVTVVDGGRFHSLALSICTYHSSTLH